jgi:hypothetical protein
MTIALILVGAALCALLFFVWLAKGHASALNTSDNPAEHLRSVDVEAFRNLIDPDEEHFLKTNLPAAEFRKIQRERLRAALEYIACAAHNAAILLRMGEVARRSPDATIAEAGEKLVDSAIRLRLYAFHAMAKLYLGMIVPGARISPARVAEGYEQMTRLVIRLGCLQPAARGVSVAL